MSKRRNSKSERNSTSERSNTKRRKEAGSADASRQSKAQDDLDSSFSKPSKKMKSSTAKPLPKSTAKPLSRSASSKAKPLPRSISKPSTQTHPIRQTITKTPEEAEDRYMGTLESIAPPMDKKAVKESKKGIVLNDEETNADLGDVIELFDSEEEEDDKRKHDHSEEEEEDEEENTFARNREDDMNVKDVTKAKKKKKTKKGSSRNGKVLETDFEDFRLARLAKSSVRLAICIKDMWPHNDKVGLELLEEALGKRNNREKLASLAKITENPEDLEDFVRFVSVLTSMLSQIGTQSLQMNYGGPAAPI
ncbi:hypothetical protein EV360DRAFT_86970 [Lentinula raphanica]|nr:hypothetical protein EV360DRAFT_86970 [Lentinula raphanica]